MGLLAGTLAVVVIAYFVPRLPSSFISNFVTKPAARVAATAGPPGAHGGTKPSGPARPADHLRIPALGVNAPVTPLGLLKDGSLDTPQNLWQVGWYKGGVRPGMPGAAIIDGHSGAPGQIGVFEHLDHLRPGTTLSYTYIDGHSFNFKVTSSAAYPLTTAAIQRLFTPTGPTSLNLVSCYGKWDPKTSEYNQRWIVTAVLQP